MFIALYNPDGNSVVLNTSYIVAFTSNDRGGTSIITTGLQGEDGKPYCPIVQESAAQVYDMIVNAKALSSQAAKTLTAV